jgi:hypothetical protein
MKITTDKHFYVPADSLKFTDENLRLHKKCFNPEIRPEYFYFKIDGDAPIEYVGDYIISDTQIRKAKNHISQGGIQLFRKGINTSYSEMCDSIGGDGPDLREKLSSVLLDLDPNEEVPKPDKMNIEYIFSGNTFDLSISKRTSLKNRIVSVFRKTKTYSLDKLIPIGTRLNSESKPESKQSIDSAEHSLIMMIKHGSSTWKLSEDATGADIAIYTRRLKERVAYMLNVKLTNKVFETNKLKTVFAKIVEKQLNRTTIISIGNSTSTEYLLKILEGEGLINNSITYHEFYGAFASKLYTHWTKLQNNFSKNATYEPHPNFDIFNDRSVVNTLIHLGTPDIEDPKKHWIDEATKFISEWDAQEAWIQSVYFHDRVFKNNRWNVVGILQQVEALTHRWKMGTIVPLDEVREFLKEEDAKKQKIVNISEYQVNELEKRLIEVEEAA